ncbi:MAG TPA: hypothetical protein VI521_01330 [Candidatus Babeliales bacterium]|nr:hypothetical protein [Candidatus Babeliales bacterium]
MKRILPIVLALSAVFHSRADIEIQKMFPLNAAWPVIFGGYIKHESFWDTRQVVGTSEDQVLLYPEPIDLDSNCEDINAQGQFTSVAIQTRMRFEINGPDIKNAGSKGVIEYDFFGKSGITNIIRMRHAHIILNWEKAELLAGQAYHPLYVIGVDPRTISFNTGIPLDTFARDPQVRVTYKPSEHLHLVFCASTQLDSLSDGPIGRSSSYLRNAIIPMLDFRLDTYVGKHRIGAGAHYLRIQPRLKTNTDLKTRESLNSAIAIFYSKLTWDSVDTRTKFIFYQNATDQNIIGGYAVSYVEPTTDTRKYTNLNGVAVWNDTDITKSKSVIPGWFIGFAKNIGANRPIIQSIDTNGTTEKTVYGFGTDIDYIFRIAPRVQWKINNLNFAVEIEYTRAAFGTIDCDGNVINTNPVGNTRILASLFYYL